MKRDIEQKNQAYKKALGRVIPKLFPDRPIIVSDLLLDPSMQHGKVWVRASSEDISQLNQRLGDISKQLTRIVSTRYMPSLEFVMDDNYLEKINDLFSTIEVDEK